MTRPCARRRLAAIVLAGAAAWLGTSAARAHSASDAYLSLERGADGVVHGQWDIALRDLDFVLGLDDDGDGNLTWGEVHRHQGAIARYALARLTLHGPGRDCPLTLTRQWIDGHADGAYMALFFEARCAAPSQALSVDYRLFFDIDPSHRAIVVVDRGRATAVLSPQQARIELKPAPGAR